MNPITGISFWQERGEDAPACVIHRQDGNSCYHPITPASQARLNNLIHLYQIKRMVKVKPFVPIRADNVIGWRADIK